MIERKEILHNLTFDQILSDDSIPDNAVLRFTKKELKDYIEILVKNFKSQKIR